MGITRINGKRVTRIYQTTVVVSCAIVVGLNLFIVRSWILSAWQEENAIRSKYEMIKLGCPLSEAEHAIDMSATILTYGGGTDLETIDEQQAAWPRPSLFFSFYRDKKYVIAIYYDACSERVTGKELFLLNERGYIANITSFIRNNVFGRMPA